MMQAARPIALLDACVLYPAPVRDLLLYLADAGLYVPKWTDSIHNEWTRNLLLNRRDLTAGQLQRTTEAMNGAFPDATVQNYEALIHSISLPDPNDCHVLAAAIRSQSQIIVTANLKDFPNDYLSQFDIEAQHPDRFITDLIELSPGEALRAFLTQVSTLKNPPKTAQEVVHTLRKVSLNATAARLMAML